MEGVGMFIILKKKKNLYIFKWQEPDETGRSKTYNFFFLFF